MRGAEESCLVRYPGEGEPRSHAHSGILVMGGGGQEVMYPGEGTQKVMHSHVSW